MHGPISPAIDRTIKPVEVMGWFKRGHQPWPPEEACAELAARLSKMSWPIDPPLPAFAADDVANPWWDPQAAAEKAKALQDDVPAMLCFWHRMQDAPKEWVPEQLDKIELPEGIRQDLIKQFVPGLRVREGYDVIDRLRVALEAALPYIEFPFGKYERQDHRERKRPAPWHTHAVVIAPWIAATLRQAGHDVRGTSRNTALVRIVREALLRIGYDKEDIMRTAVAAHLSRWYREHGRVL